MLYCSPITNLYGIALFMLPAFPLTSGTSHTLNRKKLSSIRVAWGHAELTWCESWPHMDLCNKWYCFHPNFDARCICICVKSFSKACCWACNKKIPVQKKPSPSLSRHSTTCLEFQVPTVFLLPKQLRECLPTYKHSLLLFTLTLGR